MKTHVFSYNMDRDYMHVCTYAWVSKNTMILSECVFFGNFANATADAAPAKPVSKNASSCMLGVPFYP